MRNLVIWLFGGALLLTGLSSCTIVGFGAGFYFDRQAREPISEGPGWIEPLHQDREIALTVLDTTYLGLYKGYNTRIKGGDTLRSVMLQYPNDIRDYVPTSSITYTRIEQSKGYRKFVGLGIGLVIDVMIIKDQMRSMSIGGIFQ